jgi:hypothetical protein
MLIANIGSFYAALDPGNRLRVANARTCRAGDAANGGGDHTDA